jgi:hypothetical protein
MVQLSVISGCGDEAVTAAASLLEAAGLEVTRSFDLHATRAFKGGCACPHHNTTVCDCHYAVLLVRGPGRGPVVLLVHGRDGVTWFSLAPDPDNLSEADALVTIIGDSLKPLARPTIADCH